MKKKQYLCSGFENVKYTLQNPTELTNLFCTLNKQTNTLEKQTSRRRLFSLSKSEVNRP